MYMADATRMNEQCNRRATSMATTAKALITVSYFCFFLSRALAHAQVYSFSFSHVRIHTLSLHLLLPGACSLLLLSLSLAWLLCRGGCTLVLLSSPLSLLQAYMHAYKHTYKYTYMQTYTHAYKQTCMYAYNHTCSIRTHTYIPTCHTYILNIQKQSSPSCACLHAYNHTCSTGVYTKYIPTYTTYTIHTQRAIHSLIYTLTSPVMHCIYTNTHTHAIRTYLHMYRSDANALEPWQKCCGQLYRISAVAVSSHAV